MNFVKELEIATDTKKNGNGNNDSKKPFNKKQLKALLNKAENELMELGSDIKSLREVVFSENDDGSNGLDDYFSSRAIENPENKKLLARAEQRHKKLEAVREQIFSDKFNPTCPCGKKISYEQLLFDLTVKCCVSCNLKNMQK